VHDPRVVDERDVAVDPVEVLGEFIGDALDLLQQSRRDLAAVAERDPRLLVVERRSEDAVGESEALGPQRRVGGADGERVADRAVLERLVCRAYRLAWISGASDRPVLAADSD